MTLHTEMTNGITKQRRMCWDEENRMLLSADEEQMAAYVYDAAGCSLSFSSKRSTHKASGTTVSSTVNGYPSAFGTIGALTLYPSELMTVSNGMYTKHYYNGSARIASRIGGGFVAHSDWNDYNPLTDHVSLLQTPSYDHKADQLRQLWSRSAECAGLNPNLEYAYSLEGSGLYLSLTRTADGERYFYHSDHLGSSAFITTEMRSIREDLQKTNTPEQNGYATQFLAYMPYGETLDEQQNGTSYYSPFKFSAKEQDLETGYSYFGARYYSPQLSVWLSVDPMSDHYQSHSAYNYTLLNPVKFIDPDGRSVWHPDSEGNLIADPGDNALTLSEHLGISYEEANTMFSDLNNWDGGNNRSGISDVAGHTLSMTDPGLRIGNIAEYYEGSTNWSLHNFRGDFWFGDYKCNQFVYEITTAAGASPGLPNKGGMGARLIGKGPYPPTAGQWGDPHFNISNWKSLDSGETIRRGDVISIPNETINATGHVGIVLRPGVTISASTRTVVKNNWGFRADNAPRLRRFSAN